MTQELLVGDRLDVRAYCVDQNQASVNVHTYRVQDVGFGTTDYLLCRTISGLAAPAYRAVIHKNAVFVGISLAILRPSLGGYTRYFPQQSANGAGAGAVGSNAQPKQIAGLTTWMTNFAGKGFRGRTYWPFVGIFGAADNEAPSSGIHANLIALAHVFGPQPTFSSGDANVVCQKVIIHKPKPEKVGETDIIDVRTAGLWATQRRRGDYGAANVSPITVSTTLPMELQLIVNQLRQNETPQTLQEQRLGHRSVLDPGPFKPVL